MASVITLGLVDIKVGAPAADGGPGTTLAKIGKTYKNTCNLVQDVADVTEHFEEGKASPEVRRKFKKSAVLTFSIMDPDLQFLSDYVGGAVSGSGASATWNFDGAVIIPDKTVVATPQQGLEITIPRGDIEAVINSDFSDEGIFLVDFTVTPLTPTKTGVGPVQAKVKA
ncbi:hypothetical protein [Albibacterium profundi]|uniref:Phage tail protein n=1 Tax=Albibacterium profundi TaxID=3134906 RepID=A0ABV5CFF9_9SPHI